MQKTLIRFRHGLGDAVQFTIVLKHIKHYHPNWIVDIESPVGHHACFYGLCNMSHRLGVDKLDVKRYWKVHNLIWDEPHNISRHDVPATKVTKSLIEQFRMEPIPDLYYYEIATQKNSFALVDRYIAKLPKRKGFVLIHYQGNSSADRKNIPEEVIRNTIKFILAGGFNVVILDWDGRSKLSNSRTVFCPDNKDPLWQNTHRGNAATIAALVARSDLFIGVDSGPLHVAGATCTPAIGVWTGHHPVNYCDLSSNVMHLLPDNAVHNIISKDVDKTNTYFEEHYRHRYYHNLEKSLLQNVQERLGICIAKSAIAVKPVAVNVVGVVYDKRWLAIGSNPGNVSVL